MAIPVTTVNGRNKPIWVIWDVNNKRCATVDSAGTAGIKHPLHHLSMLVTAYDRCFPENAPHVAEMYYHHSTQIDVNRLFYGSITSTPP